MMEDSTHSTIRELWVGSDLTQEEIAVIVGVTPDSLSRYIDQEFSKAERKERLTTILATAQTEERVANPSWYKGPGRSVPLKIIVYCQQHELKCLPHGKAVVFVNGNNSDYDPHNLLLLDSKDAKKLRELRLRNKARCQGLDSPKDTNDQK